MARNILPRSRQRDRIIQRYLTLREDVALFVHVLPLFVVGLILTMTTKRIEFAAFSAIVATVSCLVGSHLIGSDWPQSIWKKNP